MTDTEEKSKSKSPPKAKVFMQYFAAQAACMNAFSMGCAMGWTSAAVVFYKDFTSMQMTILSAIFVFFIGIFMMILGPFIPRIGNRNAMIYITPILVGAWCMKVVNNYAVIVASRVLIGISGGIGGVAGPLFIGEMSETHIRGTLAIIYQLNLCLGILYAFAFGVLESEYWAAGSSAVASVFCFVLCFMPETPIFHLKKKNVEAARKSLVFYRGKQYDVEPELQVLQQYLDDMATGESTCELLKKRQSKRALAICAIFHILQQSTGIKSVIFYSHKIFEEVYGHPTHLSSLLVMGTLVVVTVVCAYLVEIAGRKVLLIFSYSGITICNWILTAFLIYKRHKDIMSWSNYIPVVMSILYITTYSFGAGPVPWSYQAELFPAKVKYIIGPVAGGLNYLSAFVWLCLFPVVTDNLGMEYGFLMFAVLATIGVFFAVFVAVETKGKNLEEVQEMLRK